MDKIIVLLAIVLIGAVCYQHSNGLAGKDNAVRRRIVLVIAASVIFAGCVSTYIMPSPESEEVKNMPDILSNADINHTTYYEKDNGDIIKYENGKKADSISAVWALAGEWKEKKDGTVFYNKILYAEIENGYRFAFSKMKINGIGFKEYEAKGEKKYAHGYSYDLSNDEKDGKYALVLTCSEKFNMDDIEMYLYNTQSGNEEAICCDFENKDIDSVNLCHTYHSSIHFIRINGHYYLIDQSVDAKYLESDENHEKVAITEDCILWMDKKASAKELFQTISKNYQWANEQGGKVFSSTYASLKTKKINGKYYLVKTGRTDIDDEKASPCYITYKEKEEDGVVYLSIV